MKRVLVVDDEQRTLDGLSARIVGLGPDFSVCGTARNGRDALSLLSSLNPDIALCDVMMPEMDGIGFAVRARELDPALAIVFLSGYSEKEYLRTAIRVGAVDYLYKPVDEAEFRGAMLRAARRRDEADAREPGRMTQADFEAALGGARVDGKRGAFVVAALSVLGERARRERDLFRLSLESSPEMRGDYRCLCADREDGCALLIEERSGAGGAALEEAAARIIGEAMAQLEGAQVRAGVGRAFESSEELAPSYALAQAALDVSFFRGFGAVATIGSARGGRYSPGRREEAELKRLCEGEEPERLREELGRVFARFAANELSEPADARSYVALLARYMSEAADERLSVSLDITPDEAQQETARAGALSRLVAIADGIVTKFERGITLSGRKSVVMLEVKRYVYSQIGKKDGDVSLKAIAAHVYLSPTYLCTLWREICGCTLNDHIQNARIARARQLLSDTSLSVDEIADRVGYRSVRYFTKVFAEHEGESPAEYRRRA